MTPAAQDPIADVVWMIRGQWVTLAIRAAVELGIFDLLDEPRTVADLATTSGSDPATLARLVRALADLGLVEVAEPNVGPTARVSVTSRGATLGTQHPGGLRSLALMQTVLPNLASWQRLADAVRTGDSVFEAINGIGPWESLAADPEQEAIFNASMARRGRDQATAIRSGCDLTGVELLVDVGGGRGALLGELLNADSGLRGVVAERPAVADAATQHLADAGLAGRGRGAPADFFESVPAGADVYVVANVIHDWDDADSIRILRTIRTAMGPEARLWVVEQVLDAPGRSADGLRDLHLVDLHMLVMFGARERSAFEYDELLTAAGFEPGQLLAADGPWDVIETRPSPAQ